MSAVAREAIAALWRACQLMLIALADSPEGSIQERAMEAALRELGSNEITRTAAAEWLDDEPAEPAR
jgi:hypothetical protein